MQAFYRGDIILQHPLVRVERRRDVCLVVMDSPETMNAMDQRMGPALAGALEGPAAEDGVGAVVLAGAGGVFSAGGDLARAHRFLERRPDQGAGSVFAGYTIWVHRVLAAIMNLGRPLICAAAGAASGAGLGWMLAADLVALADDAKLVTGFLGVGLTPGAGISLTLPRLFGLKRATELLMLNRPLSPRQALDWGLADVLAPAPEVLPLALELAAQAAAAPGRRQAGVRNLLARAAHGELLAQSQRERREVIRAADLPEFRRRVKRFLGRKRPRR